MTSHLGRPSCQGAPLSYLPTARSVATHALLPTPDKRPEDRLLGPGAKLAFWYHFLSAWKVFLFNSFMNLPILVEIKFFKERCCFLLLLYSDPYPIHHPSTEKTTNLLSPNGKKGPITAERHSDPSWWAQLYPRALWKVGNQHSLGLLRS